MHFLNQNRIEKIKTDRQYRRDLFHKKSKGLKILISKFSLLPAGELHPGLLRDICEIDYVLDFIREIDYQDEITKTKLGVDWEPFMGESFFEGFQKLPQPVSDRMMEHLVKSVPDLIQDIYTKVSIDISEIENEQDPEKIESLDQQNDENIFINNGATWTVRFMGKEKTIKHSKGMTYIAYLLKHQGNEFTAMNLKGTLDIDFELVDKQIYDNQDDSLMDVTEPMKSISPEDLNILKNELEKIKKKLNKAMMEHDERTEKTLSNTIKQTELYILSFTSRGGKIRNIPDANEKARQSVWAAIKTAKNNIREHHKALFKHFDKHIHTGNKSRYTPKTYIYWNVKL